MSSAIVEFVTPVLVAFAHLHLENAKITGKIYPIIKSGDVKIFPFSTRVAWTLGNFRTTTKGTFSTDGFQDGYGNRK